MSLAINPLRPVKIMDPLVDVKESRMYGVLQGGQRVSYRNFISTSFSNNNAVFSCPPPSPNIFVDRKVEIKMNVNIQFTGDAGAGNVLLNSGYDALRSYPVSSILETLNLQINNNTVSINIRDIIKPLLHYNQCQQLTEYNLSTSPVLQDRSQTYESLSNSNMNPLKSYQDSSFGSITGRGAFPMEIVSNTQTSAEVNVELTEELYISPLSFGTRQEMEAFIGVQTFQVTFNWASNLQNLIWSHNPDLVSNFSVSSVTLREPSLLFKYITPNNLEILPAHREYEYFELQRYPTNVGSLAPGVQSRVSSSNIQLNSVPRQIYVFARRQNSELDIDKTDSYLAIQNISINWDNRSGLLSNASPQDLYRLSVKNGCNLSWNEWSGQTMHLLTGGQDVETVGAGSVLCIEFGTDIGLSDNMAPGINGTFQLQYEVTLENVHPTDTFGVTLYTVIVSEGIFVIEANSSFSQIGVISNRDILLSRQQEGINYNDLSMMSGTSFFGRLRKNFPKYLRSGMKFARKTLPVAEKLASDLGHSLPYGPQVGAVLDASKALSYGYAGGALVGGALKTVNKLPPAGSKIGRAFSSYAKKNKIKKTVDNYNAFRVIYYKQSATQRKQMVQVAKLPKNRACRYTVRRPRKKKGGALVGGEYINREELEDALMNY